MTAPSIVSSKGPPTDYRGSDDKSNCQNYFSDRLDVLQLSSDNGVLVEDDVHQNMK